jgi:hypothetical protein
MISCRASKKQALRQRNRVFTESVGFDAGFSTKTRFLATRKLKKPGFLPNLWVLMRDFSTKTRFLATRKLKKPGFLPLN